MKGWCCKAGLSAPLVKPFKHENLFINKVMDTTSIVHTLVVSLTRAGGLCTKIVTITARYCLDGLPCYDSCCGRADITIPTSSESEDKSESKRHSKMQLDTAYSYSLKNMVRPAATCPSTTHKSYIIKQCETLVSCFNHPPLVIV